MRFFAFLLTLLIATDKIRAQRVSEPTLQLRVLEDPGPALAGAQANEGFSVLVTDGAGTPVAEAAVALRLPERGATGRFVDGTHARVIYTNAAGEATFPGIQWDRVEGIAEVRITAAKNAAHAGLLLQQQISTAGQALAKAQIPVLPAAPKLDLPEEPSKPLADIEPVVVSRSGATVPKNDRHPLKPDPPATTEAKKETKEPTVSITNSPTGASGRVSLDKRKWTIIAAVGAAAAVGAMFAVNGHGAAAAGAPANSGGITGGVAVVPH